MVWTVKCISTDQALPYRKTIEVEHHIKWMNQMAFYSGMLVLKIIYKSEKVSKLAEYQPSVNDLVNAV